MRHPLLYEINTRCWLAELSETAGHRLTLAEVPETEFDFWHRCGFTHIWLMGVWSPGERGQAWSRKCFQSREDEFGCSDIAGSPYAIADYRVPKRLGGDAALEKFRQKLNAGGIKLLLDFVPNHTALDHSWVKSSPEFYVTSNTPRTGTAKPYRGALKWFAHGHSGHGSPWMDTLQLDYRNPRLRQAMVGELSTLADKCDGVRCDMAMLVLTDVFARTWREFAVTASEGSADSAPSGPPAGEISNEFWCNAIAALRQRHPCFLLLAEAYWGFEARLQELGFDFTYDKLLYDQIVAHDPIGAVQYLRSLSPGFLSRSTHFIENHDEPRIASLLPFEEHRAAALLILALPGMRFLHEGQLSGLRIHANVHFAKRGAETPESAIAIFYEHLLVALSRTAVGNGEWKLLKPGAAWASNPTHDNIVLVQWQMKSAAFDLVVINLSTTRSQCYAPLQVNDLANATWRLADLLDDEVHERAGSDLSQRGLYLDLPPHGAQVFHCERIQ
jgi:glycosidase